MKFAVSSWVVSNIAGIFSIEWPDANSPICTTSIAPI